MASSNPNPPSPPDRAAEQILADFADLATPESRRRAMFEWLLAAVEAAVFVPVLFLLENFLLFRTFEVSDLGWGVTIFFVLYCLLWVLGIFFFPRTQYHATVARRTRFRWLDNLAGFWLVACAFGPFFGWIATTGTIPITPSTWRWLYGFKALVCVVFPILCILPMFRYIRGKAALIQLPLLLGITFLPVMCGLHVTQDLLSGPSRQIDPIMSQPVLYLVHTHVRLPS